jgi:hypothetical protein
MASVVQILSYLGYGSILVIWFLGSTIMAVGGIASLIGLKQLWLIRIGPMTLYQAAVMVFSGIGLLIALIYAFLPHRKEKNNSAES